MKLTHDATDKASCAGLHDDVGHEGSFLQERGAAAEHHFDGVGFKDGHIVGRTCAARNARPRAAG